MPNRWLFKTEPSAYSFPQLQAERRTTWDGVKNPLALKHLSQVKEGDLVLVYHTGSEKAVAGVARVVKGPFPDPKKKDPRLLVVDIEAVKPLRAPVTLATIRANPRFAGFELLRLPRLSVMPVSEAQWKEIERLAEADR